MPPDSSKFPWPSYYGHFHFFEERMNDHNCVDGLKPLGNGHYQITRNTGDVIDVFICECYSFGVAEYVEVTQNFGHIDAIIINSNWCRYTNDVKQCCRQKKVGVFTIREFMAALNHQDFWMYLDNDN